MAKAADARSARSARSGASRAQRAAGAGSARKGGASRPAFPRVHPRVLSEQLVDELRKMILTGGLPPGHRLVETDIAEQMGVSRAPVREAIRRLERDGLVELFPHRGAVVVGVTEDEMGAIYEIRAAIESEAFVRACERIEPDQMDLLDELVEQMGRHVESGATAELIESDLAFHRLVLDAAGYAVLRRVWDGLDGILRVRMMQAIERDAPSSRFFLDDTVRAHRDLLQALRNGDCARAADLVRTHIIGVSEHIVERARESDSSGARP